MTNTWKRFIAVTVLLVATVPLGARAAVNVYAEDIPGSAIVPTNPPAADAGLGGAKASDAKNPPVRIDETGVHVGGPNPVDINVPDFARRRGEWGTNAIHLTGILAVVGTFGMPVAIIALAGYFGHRRNKLAHETMRAMIEKGVPMTPELVAEIRNRSGNTTTGGRSRRLLPGLILAGIGTALLIGGSKGDSKGGWIVLFIGAAFLIVWFVEQKGSNNGQPPR
jgi:MFS family permease